MKKLFKLLTITLTIIMSLCVMFACTPIDNSSSTGNSSSGGTQNSSNPDPAPIDPVDYVSQLKLDMNSSTAKIKTTVKIYIDGDTTHFNVPDSVVKDGVLKARYLAINTPESTGRVEPYGKVASDFTKAKLQSATSIIVESDDENWNADSTGSRYLVWVWYRTSETAEYRNLNLEILQNGLCIGNSTLQNRYGTTCMAALNQAKTLKLYVHSGEQDPTFYYGEAIPMTLKELRVSVEDYLQKTVAVEGVVTRFYNDGVYIEDYDEESDMYYGFYCYYSKTASSDISSMMKLGNRVRIVGTATEFQGSYQISGLLYDESDPDSVSNTKVISTGNEASYRLTDVETFFGKKTLTLYKPDEQDPDKTVEVQVEFDYNQLALQTSVTFKNLTIKKGYTTSSENVLSNGAITLTCECNGVEIIVRTMPLKDENKNLVTYNEYFKGKTITEVRGIVELFDGKYQIKVFKLSDIILK